MRETWREVERLHALWLSPDQIAAHMKASGNPISHETIYVHIWADNRRGGGVWRHLRQAAKKRRKRYGAYDSCGKLAGKRHISERSGECADKLVELISLHAGKVATITADNGTEFHAYMDVEQVTGVVFYFRHSLPLMGACHQ